MAAQRPCDGCGRQATGVAGPFVRGRPQRARRRQPFRRTRHDRTSIRGIHLRGLGSRAIRGHRHLGRRRFRGNRRDARCGARCFGAWARRGRLLGADNPSNRSAPRVMDHRRPRPQRRRDDQRRADQLQRPNAGPDCPRGHVRAGPGRRRSRGFWRPRRAPPPGRGPPPHESARRAPLAPAQGPHHPGSCRVARELEEGAGFVVRFDRVGSSSSSRARWRATALSELGPRQPEAQSTPCSKRAENGGDLGALGSSSRPARRRRAGLHGELSHEAIHEAGGMSLRCRFLRPSAPSGQQTRVGALFRVAERPDTWRPGLAPVARETTLKAIAVQATS